VHALVCVCVCADLRKAVTVETSVIRTAVTICWSTKPLQLVTNEQDRVSAVCVCVLILSPHEFLMPLITTMG